MSLEPAASPLLVLSGTEMREEENEIVEVEVL